MAESEKYEWSRPMMPKTKQGNDAIRILAGECTITRITNVIKEKETVPPV
jgi:hypothetical protein